MCYIPLLQLALKTNKKSYKTLKLLLVYQSLYLYESRILWRTDFVFFFCFCFLLLLLAWNLKISFFYIVNHFRVFLFVSQGHCATLFFRWKQHIFPPIAPKLNFMCKFGFTLKQLYSNIQDHIFKSFVFVMIIIFHSVSQGDLINRGA